MNKFKYVIKIVHSSPNEINRPKTPDKIQWDTQTQDGLLKCKVDNEHGYNVLFPS